MSLDLCPEFMGDVLGQSSILFQISQQLLPMLEGISVEKSKLDFISHLKLDEKCEMGVILGRLP